MKRIWSNAARPLVLVNRIWGDFADEREGRSTLSEGTAAVIGGRKTERRSNDKSPDSRRPTERPKSGQTAEPVRRSQSTYNCFLPTLYNWLPLSISTKSQTTCTLALTFPLVSTADRFTQKSQEASRTPATLILTVSLLIKAQKLHTRENISSK